MELPAESPGVIGEGRLLQDLRDIPDEEVSSSGCGTCLFVLYE